MPRVLTDVSLVDCGHNGRVSTVGTSKLRVDGAPVLLPSGVEGKTVASSCTVQDTSSTRKCRNVTAVTAGRASKLRVAGAPVLLDTLAGTTGEGAVTTAAFLRASAGQSKMEAI